MGNIFKTIVVLILGSIITFAGITACIYWLNTSISLLNIGAFIFAYFIVLKPTTKYWAGFLVYLAEYKTIKAQMEHRKAIMEKFKEEMQGLQSENEEERSRIIERYKGRTI
jgi:hypothetical protein